MILRIVLFAVMLVGLGGLGSVAWVSSRPAPPQAVKEAVEASSATPKVALLVAGPTLRAGSLIKPEDLASHEYDKSAGPEGATVDTPAARGALIGAMVRRSLAPNEVVLPPDVMRPGDHGFLAAVLGAGKRATSVSVDAVSGSAGLIWPGDRIDLILMQKREDNNLPAGRRVGAETVLSDVRVIAIDQHLVQGSAPDAAANNAGTRTATLEVTPEQAERVAVAAQIGKLSLTVRSAEDDTADNATPAQSSVTWAGDVSPSLNPSSGTIVTNTMHVYLGSADTAKEFKF